MVDNLPAAAQVVHYSQTVPVVLVVLVAVRRGVLDSRAFAVQGSFVDKARTSVARTLDLVV